MIHRKWARLKGQEFDLQSLAILFNSPELSIEQEGSSYYLKSNKFDGLKDGELHDYAVNLLEIVNGAAKVAMPDFQPVEVDAVATINEDGRKVYSVHLSATLTARGRARATLSVGEESKSPSYHEWVTIGESNPDVKKALGFFKKGGWVDLYKVLEIIRSGDNILGKGWATASKIECFKHTANSSNTLGGDARHAAEKTLPPRNPMNLSEAQAFISEILRQWLDSKR